MAVSKRTTLFFLLSIIAAAYAKIESFSEQNNHLIAKRSTNDNDDQQAENFDDLTNDEVEQRRADIHAQLHELQSRRIKRYDENRDCCKGCIERNETGCMESSCCRHVISQTCPHAHKHKCGLPSCGASGYDYYRGCCGSCGGRMDCIRQNPCCGMILGQPCPHSHPPMCGIPYSLCGIGTSCYDYSRLCCGQCHEQGRIGCDETECCKTITQKECPYKCPDASVDVTWNRTYVEVECPGNIREKCGMPTVEVVTKKVTKIMTVTQSPFMLEHWANQIIEQLEQELRIYRETQIQRIEDIESKSKYELELQLSKEYEYALEILLINEDYNISQAIKKIRDERFLAISSLKRDHEHRRIQLEETFRQRIVQHNQTIVDFELSRRKDILHRIEQLKIDLDRRSQTVVFDGTDIDRIVIHTPAPRVYQEPGSLQRAEVAFPVYTAHKTEKEQCCNRCYSQSCGTQCSGGESGCVRKGCDRCRCNHSFISCP